jgi:polyphosphate kinase
MGLLTANPIVTEDIGRLFNHLSGMAQETHYKRLLVAPHGIRNGLIDRINHEIANHEDAKPAGIKIKVNSIVDEATSDALYRASGWSAGGPVGTRHLYDPARCRVSARTSECVASSAASRAQPALLVRQRRIALSRHRLRRPDAPQPRPPRGGTCLNHQSSTRREIEGAIRHRLRREGTASWHLQPDGTWIPHTTDATVSLLDMQEYLINATSRAGLLRSSRSVPR